jgi:murein tripeptide amidase MpaA
MKDRYFVEIIASDQKKIVDLQKLDLDLFQATVKTNKDKKEFSIEGLITLEDVNKLTQGGYKVLVKKEAPKRTPAVDEISSFQNWKTTAERSLKGLGSGFKEEGTGEKTEEPSSLMLSFSGYLTAEGIEATLQYMSTLYHDITELIPLPEKTHEGRTSRALKISKKSATPKNGILFLGGVHAREILNPDLLVKFALSLCNAYVSKTGLTFGGKAYSEKDVQQLVDGLEIFVFPLVNPDGRSFVQSPNGDVWWRKNKNPNPGLPSMGVDINRNYDFLWDSGIGTSTNSVSEIYRGKQPKSEPETRNVVHLINKYENIACIIDVHSYSQTVLYPWGDDDNQSEDPDMNFRNPGYDGDRGHPGDSNYREYIHAKDLKEHDELGKKIKEAISSYRNTLYTVQQSIGLYPTSGTCDDYVYSLRYNGADRNIMGYTIETATKFQPTYEEATNVMAEVSTGLVESCLQFSRPMEP